MRNYRAIVKIVATAFFLFASDLRSHAETALERNIASATKEHPWENSLEMKFVPVSGTKVLFSIWDTRLQDYEAFVKATGREWRRPDFKQDPTHPAVRVSWIDAQAFCEWLTEKERTAGKIGSRQNYRLPTDEEWSTAAGLPTPTGKGIRSMFRDMEHYSWGTNWPPTKGAGNYDPGLNVDKYDNTSPVGSFSANIFGLYDMGGNVWQWCEDRHSDEYDRMSRAIRSVAKSQSTPSEGGETSTSPAASTPPKLSPRARREADEELAKARKAEDQRAIDEINGIKHEWRGMRGASWNCRIPDVDVIDAQNRIQDARRVLLLSSQGSAVPTSFRDNIGFRVVLGGWSMASANPPGKND